MGYIYTIKFDLEDDDEIRKYITELKKEGKGDKRGGFKWCECEDGYKTWLNCERDISMISEKFPDVLITVYREHESISVSDYYDGKTYEDCCLTVQYFKNGKFTKEKSSQIMISFEKFDEKLL